MTNRVLIDDGARWILYGEEQERENRTDGVKALYSMLASTTSGRAKELVKQGLSDRNGMIAFGRMRERFGKTAGVAKLSDVFQFQWTSSDSLEDKWLMRQVNMTSLGDDARETLTITGLEKAKERSPETTLTSACSTNLDSVVCKRGSVLANDGVLEQSAHANGNWCRDVKRVLAVAKLDTTKRAVGSAMPSAATVARLDISERCADNVRNLLAQSSPSSSGGKSSGKDGTSRGSNTDKCYCCGQVGHRPT